MTDRLAEVLALGRAKAAEAEPQLEGDSPADDAVMRARRRAIRTHGFGLPQHAAELVIANRLYSTAPLSIVDSWVKAPTPVLVLVGDPGLGKSVAVSWGALERIAGGPMAYVLESDLAEWRWARRRHAADWQRVVDAWTLVIDEIGRTDRARRELARVAVAEVLHERTTRWPWGRKTMLTGNLTIEDLAEVLDPRLEDRLEEIGSVKHVTGPSLRGAR